MCPPIRPRQDPFEALALNLINAVPWDEVIKACLAPVQHHHTHMHYQADTAQVHNPYRRDQRAQTVGQVEAMLMQQPNSLKQQQLLRELASYPQTMPIAELPKQAIAMLTGR
jgi:hypothetical protein